MWEQDCKSYLRFLRDRKSGPVKAGYDLLSRAAACSRDEFDRYLGDFDAEMAAVRELGKLGYADFEPVPPKAGTKTFDYRARLGQDHACVEGKNLRSPITILDVFASALRQRHADEPSRYPYRLVLTYYSDNTVTESQRQEILDFIDDLRGKRAPFTSNLTLKGDVNVRINVQAGSGEAMLTRGEGPGRHGEVSLPGFLNKVSADASRAMLQFQAEPDCIRILVFNIDTPAGSILSDFLNAAVNEVYEGSHGSVRCEFLLHRHRIAPDNLYGYRIRYGCEC